MIVATAHHWINRWLVLASIRVVGVVARYDEVIHLLLEHLLASCILDVAACGTCTILAADIIVIVLNTVFDSEICKSIKLLTTRSILVSCSI